MTRNRTPTPVYLDPGMHPGLEVKGLTGKGIKTPSTSQGFSLAMVDCIDNTREKKHPVHTCLHTKNLAMFERIISSSNLFLVQNTTVLSRKHIGLRY